MQEYGKKAGLRAANQVPITDVICLVTIMIYVTAGTRVDTFLYRHDNPSEIPSTSDFFLTSQIRLLN